MTQIKICGINDEVNLKACITERADFIGFVFHQSSPRFITADHAATLIRMLTLPVKSVGLFVNPDDELLSRTLSTAPVDYIQLHGDETPERTAYIKTAFNKPIIKAISIANKSDIDQIKKYEEIADWVLCDAKTSGTLSGGNGVTFDWAILNGYKFTKPWMLSGGLNAQNVQAAITQLNPTAVDVSSGVEITRGQKDPEKIRDFIQKIR